MGQSLHIGIHVSRPADQAYSYVADPAHLPCWAAGVDAATEVRFVPPNEHLVLDHDVTLSDGSVTRNPMRVLPDGDGCDVVFTLRRGAGTSDEAFDVDAAAVRSDLQTLKERLEHYSPVEDYIAGFPPEAAAVLEEVRRRVLRAVPGAGETIRYDMPTVTMDGTPLLHFAGWKEHVSLYPAPAGDDTLDRDLAPYLSGRGTVKLPLQEPFPYDLVERVAARHVEQRHADRHQPPTTPDRP
jgi:uncharacterized protein YdhG (YjbR/CyaY superfamily)